MIIKKHATFHNFLNGNFQLTRTEVKETCDFDYRNFLSTLILCEIIRIKRCTAVVSKNLHLLYALQITRSSPWIPTIISLKFNFSFCFSLSLSTLLFIILSNGFHGGFILLLSMLLHVNNNGFRLFTHTPDLNVLVAELITL